MVDMTDVVTAKQTPDVIAWSSGPWQEFEAESQNILESWTEARKGNAPTGLQNVAEPLSRGVSRVCVCGSTCTLLCSYGSTCASLHFDACYISSCSL